MRNESDYEPLLKELVDHKMYARDARYYAQIAMFQKWLRMTEMAMEAEGVTPDAATRVLNRVVYGVPDASEAYARRAEYEQAVGGWRVGL